MPKFFIFVLGLVIVVGAGASRPNLVFVLTDDQDFTLASMQAMPYVQQLIASQGATFKNAFVSTPVCCPSRSSILTGQYIHNTKTLKNGPNFGCAGPTWVNGAEKHTAAVHLHSAGYRSLFAGKYKSPLVWYLNGYGLDQYGPAHVPPGWDEWLGLVGNSKYYNYSVSDNGKPIAHGDNYSTDYFTDLVANRTYSFVKKSFENFPEKPLLLWITPPACHEPQTPAPQYQNLFSDIELPHTPDFDKYDPNKHWLMQDQVHPFPQPTIDYLGDAYRDRLRTLVSVDDMVRNVYGMFDSAGKLNNTFFIFMSDNGYHLEQHSQPIDKRMPYENDIRVPLFIAGPGIRPSQVRDEVVVSIDIAPTLLDFAKIPIPPNIDGRSLRPILETERKTTNSTWRTDFLIEYFGEGQKNCITKFGVTMFGRCCDFPNPLSDWCQDSLNNTYTCLRTIKGQSSYIFCQFHDNAKFEEFYDLQVDPYQLANGVSSADPTLLAAIKKRIAALSSCSVNMF